VLIIFHVCFVAAKCMGIQF